jgi:uncharacterized membrane protein
VIGQGGRVGLRGDDGRHRQRLEILGILTLVVGLAAALVRAGLVLTGGQGGEEAYRVGRTVFGRSILLELEFLVAADLIRTVAVQPSLENVAVLGLIVLIRTFLSFSLEVDSATPAKTAPEPQEGMVSAVIQLNVGHALFAVVAQGRIVVVGQQPDQVIGTVPGWGNQPEGGAAGAGAVQESLLD